MRVYPKEPHPSHFGRGAGGLQSVPVGSLWLGPFSHHAVTLGRAIIETPEGERRDRKWLDRLSSHRHVSLFSKTGLAWSSVAGFREF